jgi:hypothetical protein
MKAWAFPSLADYYDDNRDRLVVLRDAPPEVITPSGAPPVRPHPSPHARGRPT